MQEKGEKERKDKDRRYFPNNEQQKIIDVGTNIHQHQQTTSRLPHQSVRTWDNEVSGRCFLFFQRSRMQPNTQRSTHSHRPNKKAASKGKGCPLFPRRRHRGYPPMIKDRDAMPRCFPWKKETRSSAPAVCLLSTRILALALSRTWRPEVRVAKDKRG